MKILGIETSCDETGAAVVEDGVKILSNIVASSVEMHVVTRGIIPENAAREQVKAIIPVIKQALKSAKVLDKNVPDIDAIAVTVGPGLIGSLLVGVETAKVLSVIWNKPLIPVNHLVAHLYANWISGPYIPALPAVALIVSGGHTDLILMKSHTDIEWLGGTLDDAAGEAFDKTARLIGLPYPGGPAIAHSAERYLDRMSGTQTLDLFPRPMMGSASLDFSFSGLKTAVLRYTERESKKDIFAIAANIQEAIIDVLIAKTLTAAARHKVKTIIVAGGVAANMRLRREMQAEIETKHFEASLHVPKVELCTDNAASIASCGYFHNNPLPIAEINANPELAVV
jgi:N6-L-threonylcarbamoyladenine synthase